MENVVANIKDNLRLVILAEENGERFYINKREKFIGYINPSEYDIVKQTLTFQPISNRLKKKVKN